MKNSQLDNLINFCFHFHVESGNIFIEHDYDYILEKWEKYIGLKPLDREVKNNGIINSYIENYKINNQKKWNKIKEIIDFLSILNQRPLYFYKNSHNLNSIWSLEEIDKLFEEKTGINILKINDIEYNHLHPLIKDEIYKWKLLDVNKRYYKLKIIGI
jgi:hypothetical protein